MPRIKVLGCSGGIGGGRQTTSFLIDGDVLLDAGSGVLGLSLDELAKIDHVLLTHAHLDHVLALPLLLDAAGESRTAPVTVYAIPEVLATLREHLFNNRIWPDFTRIPSVDAPFVRFEPVLLGQVLSLDSRSFVAWPVQHSVPACAWEIRASKTLLFSGDTNGHPDFWRRIAVLEPDDLVLIETSFPDAQSDLAQMSGHYHPAALARDWHAAGSQASLWISHLKPGSEDEISQQITAALAGVSVNFLQAGLVFEL